MKIEINNQRLLSDIQKEFNTEFPYLKIEFFETPHKRKESLPKSRMYAATRTVGACRKVDTEGSIAVTPEATVAQFEQECWDRFGLSVQVFRKSGRLWIETSLTDSWTLARQNREGMEISTHKNPFTNADDLDVTDRDKWE